MNLCVPNKLAQITVLEATKMEATKYIEWWNCEKREMMLTSLECVNCHKTLRVKAFHWNCKAKLSWNTAALECFAVEFNCIISKRNFSQKCIGNHFLVLVSKFLKWLHLRYFPANLGGLFRGSFEVGWLNYARNFKLGT